MLEEVGDRWMMGLCGEMDVSEGHNGDTTEEGKRGGGGRRGEES